MLIGVASGSAVERSAAARTVESGWAGGSTGSPRIAWIGVARTVRPPYEPTVSEMAPMIRATPSAPGQITGEPENPGPTPVASTAAPERLIRIRARRTSRASLSTPSTRASNVAMSVPSTTDFTVHDIPVRTSPSGIVGSPAACAGGAASATAARITGTARRSIPPHDSRRCVASRQWPDPPLRRLPP